MVGDQAMAVPRSTPTTPASRKAPTISRLVIQMWLHHGMPTSTVARSTLSGPGRMYSRTRNTLTASCQAASSAAKRTSDGRFRRSQAVPMAGSPAFCDRGAPPVNPDCDTLSPMRWLIVLPFERPEHMGVDFPDALVGLGHEARTFAYRRDNALYKNRGTKAAYQLWILRSLERECLAGRPSPVPGGKGGP